MFAPATVAEHQGFGLDELGQMDVGFEGCGGTDVLNKIRCDTAFVAVGFVMEVKNVGLGVEIFRVGDEGFNRGKMGEGFHAEFRVESSAKGVENLVLLLCAMPNIPLMHVSDSWVGRDFTIAPWRAWVIRNQWGFRRDNFRKDLFVDVSGWKVTFEPILRILVRIVIMKTILFLDLVIFIVTRKNDN